jgi:hypothetical protein
MFEHDNALVRARPALPGFDHRRLSAKGIPDADRLGKRQPVHAQIGHQRSECGIGDRNSTHQTESENTVYQDVAELRLRSDFGVEMHRLRVVRERREQKVVGLGNRARDLVTDHFAGHEPLEAFSRH